MSNPPKSSPFSFGQTSTSGNPSSLFGQTTSGNSKLQGSLFGTNTGAPASTKNPFGNVPATSAGSLFGQGTSAGPTLPAFGGPNAKPGTLFEGGNKPSTSGFSFGPAPQNDKSGGITQPGFLTPNKPSEPSTTGQSQPGTLFGGATGIGSSGFPKNQTPFGAPTSQPGASTPISKPNIGFSLTTSTTPAGPPPSGSEAGGNAGFNFSKTQAPKPSLFGLAPNPQPTAQDAKSNPASVFSGGSTTSGSLFGSKNPTVSDTSNITPSTNASLFGKPLSGSGTSVFDIQGKAPSSEGGFFDKLNKPKDTDGTWSGAGTSGAQQPQTTAAKPTSLFPTLGGQVSSANSFFGGPTQTVSSGISTPSLFPSIVTSQAGPPNVTTPSTAPTSGGFFSHLNPTKNNMLNPATDPKTGTTGGQQPLPAPSTKSGLFGNQGKKATSSESAQPSVTHTTENPSNPGAGLGTSTSGPAPPAQSRLKNKSMDEIITRWASDLSTYQKEFQKQAEKVSVWDRMLVENSDRIQKLYGSTLEAERATTEVERQLTTVENDQAELEIWLDHYERELNQMMSSQVGPGESLQGPDQERDKTYVIRIP